MANRDLTIKRFYALRHILEVDYPLDIDLSEILKKIDSVIETISSGEINIALIGSFSDGKTSAIAGLLGEVVSNMKIAADESSDEITVYLYHTQGKNFRIVDTPGLFGTKEKEVEGKDIRFSDMTIKYLSEAHIVIYVCNAVNPLKESHVNTIKYIMQDLDKLGSTIFVINKMDDAYDITDEIDFNRGKIIKTNTLQTRLKESLSLSNEQVNDLNIVCIAADPKGKGVESWLTKLDDYLKRSHITDFKEVLNKVVSNCDLEKLNLNVEYTSIKDMLKHIDQQIKKNTSPIEKIVSQCKETSKDLGTDKEILKAELRISKNELAKRLDELQMDIVQKIEASDHKTIGAILQNNLGMKDNMLSMWIIERDINMILSECSASNSSKVTVCATNVKQRIEGEAALIKEQVLKGAKLLKNIKVDANMVKRTRDIVAKNHKFKPWGAVKMGKNITKWISRVGAGIAVAMEAWEWYKEFRDQKRFLSLKQDLLNILNAIFSDVATRYDTDKTFYENFAPEYLDLEETLKQRDAEIKDLNEQLEKFNHLRENIQLWVNNGEYIDFEEVPIPNTLN